MIFSETTRNQKLDKTPALVNRILEDMKQVVQVGVVDPKLSGPGKPGLSVDDIFRDVDLGTALYYKILEHSLFKLKVWQIPFFFLAKRLYRLVLWLKRIKSGPATLPLKENSSA